MKLNIKGLLLSAMLTCMAFLSLLYVSCKGKDGKSSPFKDQCAAISCAYGGYCSEGKCVCPSGYEGDNCELITRDKFLSSWTVKETGTITVAREYAIAIEKDVATAPVNSVLVKLLYNYFSISVRANVVKDSIFIPNQQIMGKIVFGKGYIYADTLGQPNGRISMRYEVVDSANNNIVDDFGYYEDVYHSKPSSWTKHN